MGTGIIQNERIIFDDGRVVVRNQIIKIETPSLSELIDIVRGLQDMGNHLLNRL